VPTYEDVPEDCGRAGGLLLAHGVMLSPDQRFVYVAAGGNGRYGSNGVATFWREASSGALRPAGCVSGDGVIRGPLVDVLRGQLVGARAGELKQRVEDV
jgi:hypothetical protein